MANMHIIRLERGVEIAEGIQSYMKDKDWTGALIIAGAGSLYDVTVSNPITDTPGGQILPITVNEPCEIMSFTGEIFPKTDTPGGLARHVHEDGFNYMVHIHASVSHGSGVVNGGGFRGGKVFRAVNVYVLQFED